MFVISGLRIADADLMHIWAGMRTTVDLPPAVRRRAEELAASRGQSLSAKIAELTIRGLGELDEPWKVRSSALPSVSEQARRRLCSLRLVRGRAGYEFWPDSLSYADARLEHVHGHRQVTDAHLASLVASRPGARLAIWHEGLARARPELTLLIPAT